MQSRFSENLQIHTFPTKEEVTMQTASVLNEILKKIQQENKSILLLLSGGSAFDLLSHIDEAILTDKTTIAVLDERYSTDPKINNFAQVQQTPFYTTTQESGVKTIDTTVQENETMEQLATRFQSSLQEWKKNNPDGEIVAIVGIGPDGHTSGILPFPENPALFAELFENPDKWVVSYDADGKNPYRYRATTTNIFLRNFIDHAVVYAVGENKKEALTRLIAETGSLAETPARVLREMKCVDLFTDVVIE